jgi:hypothetical protein
LLTAVECPGGWRREFVHAQAVEHDPTQNTQCRLTALNRFQLAADCLPESNRAVASTLKRVSFTGALNEARPSKTVLKYGDRKPVYQGLQRFDNSVWMNH